MSRLDGRRGTHRRRLYLVLIALVLLGVLAPVVSDGVTLVRAARDLQRGSDLLRASARELGQPQEWNDQRLNRAALLNRQATGLLQPATAKLHADRGLSLLGRVPGISDQSGTGVDLADASLAAAHAEADLIAVAGSYLTERGTGGPLGSRLLNLLGSAAGPVADARMALESSLLVLRRDLLRRLSPQIRALVAEAVHFIEPVLQNVRTFDVLSRLLPAAIGAHGPRTYLLLLMNPAELRPSGGLIGNLGTVTFTNGEPDPIRLTAYGYFDPRLKQCFTIPAPLRSYLTFFKNCLDIGDAGWSPDFPTSSALVEQMYTSAVSSKLDGSVGIDPYALAQILRVIGPIESSLYGTLDADNFFAKIDEVVNVRRDRIAFDSITGLVFKKLLNLPLMSWPALAGVLSQQVRERHIQVAVHDAGLSAELRSSLADGSVRGNGEDDYLMIVDANMHANKADYYIKKTADVKVEVYPSGLNRHQVVLRYEYPQPAQPDATDSALNIDGRFINYVRVYLPETANLGSISYQVDGKAVPVSLGEISHELGKTVIGVTFILDRGHTGDLSLIYGDGLRPGNQYSLLVQKQSGIPERPTRVQISYPGGVVDRRTALTQDEDFLIEW